ncbi:MAG: hypothetical protein COA73_06365 [Candidatus Hydrogenedentota bacterium]|nr:MAG: hypothetical protein COA73_06365 [Candidatus Hydrogenedentota bacterium]
MSDLTNCNHIESLIVQKAYGEPLTESERGNVDAHVGTCSGCKESQNAIVQLIQGIPINDFKYEGDLLPVIHESLRESKPLPLQWLFTGGAFVLVLFMGAVFVALPRDQNVGTEIARSPATPVELALVEAQAARNDGEFAKAYVILMDAVKEDADDAHAGAAILAAGDIAYAELGWYSQAHMIYNRAQSEFYTDFSSEADAVRRYNILEEAYSIDAAFESLYALDAAMNRDTTEALVAYVARYPATFTSSDASRQIALLAIAKAEKLDDWSLAQGYEAAIASCTSPLALASLKIELAYEYTRGGAEKGKARVLLQEVVESGPTVLAQRARTSLDALDATP